MRTTFSISVEQHSEFRNIFESSITSINAVFFFKLKLNCRILASVHNVCVVSHLLALALFSFLLIAMDIKDIPKCYYKHVKYLLRLPFWTKNTSCPRGMELLVQDVRGVDYW